MTELSVSFGSFQNVKLTRSRMNGHEFLVCASQFDGTRSCGVGSDGCEFKHINDSSGSDIFTALSLTSADDLGAWCTTAMLKMKVGVVSVTVGQHTEGRLQVSQPMLNLEMALYNVVSANPRVKA